MGAEENTVVEEEEAAAVKEVEGVLVLGAASVLALLLMERSMGEQLEYELSASLLSLARLLSWVEHSLSDVTEEEPLSGKMPQLSSR